MMEEHARVVDVQDGFVWVETERKSTCGACSLNKGCGSAVLARVLGARRTRIRALNTLPAHVGDEVVLGLAEAALVRGSLILYALPLLALFLGALAGESVSRLLRLAPGETATVVFALAGLAAGFYGVRYFTRRINNDPRYQPVVLRRAWTH
ncbi:MAG: SoxR reducing system RseC family protein [Proteobacteria bacterium]|nr:SoxR reducing system RseC family protein [Pseudomonadota bacterium]